MERPSFIYWLLAVHLTILQANRVLDGLGLQELRIEAPSQVGGSAWSPTQTIDHSVEASVGATNFHFTMSRRALIFTRQKKAQAPRMTVQDWNDDDGTVGIPKGSASKQEAYRLARHWLEGAGFNVDAMEKEHPPWIEHRDLPLKNRHETDGGFAVRWGRKGAVTGTNCAATVLLNLRGEWLVSIYLTQLGYLRTPLAEIANSEDLNRLPNGPVLDFLGLRPDEFIRAALKLPGFSFTNAFHLLDTPAAYRDQMLQAMHRTASELATRLRSDCLLDSLRTNLNEAYVNPPAFGSGGRLGSDDVGLRFDTAGRLSYFSCLPQGYTNWRHYEAAATSLISSNQAFGLATQALAALSIDMARLDHAYERRFARGSTSERDAKGKLKTKPSQRYWLWWADTSRGPRPPIVMIGVCGDTGKIGMIDLRDTTYYHGPTLPIPSSKISNGP